MALGQAARAAGAGADHVPGTGQQLGHGLGAGFHQVLVHLRGLHRKSGIAALGVGTHLHASAVLHQLGFPDLGGDVGLGFCSVGAGTVSIELHAAVVGCNL